MVEPTPLQLQQIKKLETAMLSAFMDICRELKLRYYLVGGTLLGAVRHQGFIPWDDDIDVAMPREDYEIFLREGQKYLPDHLFLQCLATEPAYGANFAKIRDTRTTFVEYSVRKFPICHGVYIDVFPLDFYPDDPGEQKKMDFQQTLFRRRTRAAVDVPPQARHKLPVEMGLRAVSAMTVLRYPSYRKALEAREKLHTGVKNGEMWANYCGAWGKREIMPAKWFGEGTIVRFEGMDAVAPACPHEYLTHLYGDYMQLPPVEKRVGHHYAEFIDLDMPSGEYLRNHY